MTFPGVLVDTHVLLWALDGGERLSARHRELLLSTVPKFVSVASLWEIAIKSATGKLRMPPDLLRTLERGSVALLSIRPEHVLAVADLPRLHNDPFDRLLVVQARIEGLTLLTNDGSIARYGVSLA